MFSVLGYYSNIGFVFKPKTSHLPELPDLFVLIRVKTWGKTTPCMYQSHIRELSIHDSLICSASS